MSGATTPPPTAQNRFAVAAKGRNLAIPRTLLVVVGIGVLVVAGAVVNGVVQHWVAPPPIEDAPPPNQIRIGAPPPLVLPPDPPSAPNREAQAPTTPPAPLPRPTAAQTIAHAATDAVGAGNSRSVLMEPPKDWEKIGQTAPGQALAPPPTEAENAAIAFGAKPNATKLAGSRATAVRDLTRTIRPGTRLFCTTQEAIDTTVGAGDFVCKVDRWVQAWDGMTPLIPPESWIVVHYEELKNGRNRIFAASGLCTTPDGVVVSLGDPFSMPDGSAGVEGTVQDNTWARLKEGLILDLAQSVFQTGENLASRNSQGAGSSSLNLSMSTGNTQQAVNQALEKNRDIADVLRLPQGAHLSMTIMHPIFMQDVIHFEMRAGSR
jgi:type IV secretion system protein VirB10